MEASLVLKFGVPPLPGGTGGSRRTSHLIVSAMQMKLSTRSLRREMMSLSYKRHWTWSRLVVGCLIVVVCATAVLVSPAAPAQAQSTTCPNDTGNPYACNLRIKNATLGDKRIEVTYRYHSSSSPETKIEHVKRGETFEVGHVYDVSKITVYKWVDGGYCCGTSWENIRVFLSNYQVTIMDDVFNDDANRSYLLTSTGN